VKRLVVVGNGMAGVACVEQILRHKPKFQITIFGDETHVNYNRIMQSGPTYQGTVMASKLKIMGVDVFSAGEIEDKVDGSEVIRYEDPSLGIYKKLTLKDNKLTGVIMVGETSDSHRYMEWLRGGTDLVKLRRQLLFPEAGEDGGLDVAQMSDSETVCGCMGVTKGTITRNRLQAGAHTLPTCLASVRRAKRWTK
jgi:NAD(P)H-nitrite reductase large subunit